MAETICTASPRLRGDLVVSPDGALGEGIIVKDPRSKRFFRFGRVEGFLLTRLDGRNTTLDLQIAVASELGETLALDDIDEFLDTLRERGLVERDRAGLPAFRPDLGAKVVEALEAGGLHAPSAAALPPGSNARHEAEKFQDALSFLRAGRFQAAMRALDEILAANASNGRARAIRDLLVQAGSKAALEAASAPEHESAAKKSMLYWRLPLFNPDRLLDAMEPSFRFLFTPAFAGAYAGVLALALAVVAMNGRELFASLPSMSALTMAGGFLIAAIAQTALHESAHGLTCKHFGGKVNETGFLLIMFMLPALYVDVSDAWLFRKRRHRVLVSLAGPMVDLGVAALAAIAWRISPPGPVHTAAALAMLASAMSVLLNFNPLIRLDGYYILSDLSGIPNLRAAAGAYLGRMLSGRGSGAAPIPGRTRLFLLAYGALSTLYVIVVLGIVSRLALGWAADLAGVWGLAFLGTLVLFLLRKPLAAIGRAIGKQGTRKRARVALRLAVVGAALAALAMVPWSLKIGGPVHLDPAERAAVRAEIPGNVAEILVKEGGTVEAGQVVARLDTSELETRLAMTRAEVRRARAHLDLKLSGPEREQVQQVRERVAALRVEVEQLESRHRRLSRLRQEGLVSADMHEQVSSELRVREGALRSATEEARLVERGTRPEEIAAARAEVARLETEADDIERRLGLCNLIAPEAGVIVTPDLRERQGEHLMAGSTLLEIAASSEMIAEVRVLESEIGDVESGMPVRFVFSAFPSQSFNGRVLDIAPAADVDEMGRALFRVRASVEDPAGRLRPGMTGAAKIQAGRQPLGRVFWRRVMRLIDPSLL